MITIDRIQAQLRASAQANFTAIAAPPFTCFLNPDDPSPWSNYAIPDTEVTGDLTEALDQLVATFRAQERLPRFEFIEEFAPGLASALAAYGFVEELRTLLMVCTPATYQPAGPVDKLKLLAVTPDLPLAVVQDFLTVQRRSFGDEAAPPASEIEAAQFRQRFRTTQFFAASVDDELVSVASLLPPHAGVTELAGIATLPTFRQQGIATYLTDHTVQAAFAQGLDAVFLTAGSVAAGRVYARVGFQPVGSGLSYVWPE